MKTAAGLVLFNPNIDLLRRSLDSIKGQVDDIIVVDNTPGADLSSQLTGYGNVVYVPNKANLGIAKALNQIMEKACDQGCNWVLTLDQDSIFPENGIGAFVEALKAIGPETAMLAPVFFNRSSNQRFGQTGYVDECITSGAFTSIEAWKQIGGYNEWYFIDMVDFEFCARLVKAGYLIYQTEEVILNHQLGYPKTKKLLGLTFSSSNYPAFRYYYQARNYLVYEFQYHKPFTNPSPKTLVKKILTVDDNKIEKLLAVHRGVLDARKRIGQLDPENEPATSKGSKSNG